MLAKLPARVPQGNSTVKDLLEVNGPTSQEAQAFARSRDRLLAGAGGGRSEGQSWRPPGPASATSGLVSADHSP